MKLKNPSKKCCRKPDIKNEGFIKIDGNKISWEYHCYSCGKTWGELANVEKSLFAEKF